MGKGKNMDRETFMTFGLVFVVLAAVVKAITALFQRDDDEARIKGFIIAVVILIVGAVPLFVIGPHLPVRTFRVTLRNGTVYENVMNFHTPTSKDNSYYGTIDEETIVFSDVLKYEKE